jgi:formate/nitrite transporter FocA (FNT family)
VSAVGYPLGFIFVVLARNQLFTENTLEPVIPLLRYPSFGILKRVLSLWAVVLIGNLSGAFAFALFVQRTPLIDGELNYSLIRTAEIATAGGFWLVAYKAIFGGWLIALMAWLIASTHYTGAQVVLIWLTTAPIAAFGFKHSIAGAVEAFYLAFAGASWQAMIFDFIVPAIIGNIIGGVFLVAILNHGQVAADNASSNSRFFK